MSLLPLLFDEAHLMRPSRILDQRFGMGLEPDDFLQPMTLPRMMMRCPAGYVWRVPSSERDSGSVYSYDKDKFQANLDVQQFKPEEITVKVTGENTVTIEGKHEEKQDEHGHIYRHFIRKYTVPKNFDMSRIESKLSSDGVLTITAPKIDDKSVAPKIDDKSVEHKSIPITQTGEPAKVENKVEKKAE